MSEFEEIVVELPDKTVEFEGRLINDQILGTTAEDTRKIAYYEAEDGTFYKHVIHGINLEEGNQRHEFNEVSSMEVP